MTLIPVHVAFHGLPHSDAIDAAVRERVAWLEQFHTGIMRCQVVIEVPHRHRQDGQHVVVRLVLTIPGRAPVVVSHEPSLHDTAKDIEATGHHKDTDIQRAHRHAAVAVHEAFDAARRQLEDVARVQRGDVKTHVPPAHGRVAEIRPVEGYGFIDAGDRRVYFHRASVLDGRFDELAVGAEVAFAEEEGDKGPQASSVRVLGTHHYDPA